MGEPRGGSVWNVKGVLFAKWTNICHRATRDQRTPRRAWEAEAWDDVGNGIWICGPPAEGGEMFATRTVSGKSSIPVLVPSGIVRDN